VIHWLITHYYSNSRNYNTRNYKYLISWLKTIKYNKFISKQQIFYLSKNIFRIEFIFNLQELDTLS